MPWNMHRTYGISMGRLFCMGEKQSRSEGKTKKGKGKKKKKKKLGLARASLCFSGDASLLACYM